MKDRKSGRKKIEPKPETGRFDIGRNRPILYAAFMILILGGIVYAPVFQSPVFIQDEESILQNPLISHYKNIPRIFSQDFLLFTSGQYRPFPYAVLSGIRTFVSPNDPVFWHLWLVGFHMLNALLVFMLVRHFAVHPAVPYIAAALFCVHPLCTMPVGNINQFHIVLGTFLLLGVVNAYRCFVCSSKVSFYFLALILYLLALFTMQQALAAGLVLLVCEWLYRKADFKAALICVLPFALLPLIFYRYLFTTTPHPLHFKYVQMYAGSFWDGFFSVTGATGLVVDALLLARKIPSILHEISDPIFDVANPRFLIWASFNAFVCGTAIWAAARRKWPAFGLLLMYLCMMPYATVYFNRVDDYISFYYYYLPVAGLALFVGGCFDWFQNKKHPVLKCGSSVCMLILLAFWAGRSFQLNAVSKSPIAYWNDVVTKTQNTGHASPVAVNRLGKALLAQNDVSNALKVLFSPTNKSLPDSCLAMAHYYIDRHESLAAAIHLHHCQGKESSGVLYQRTSEAMAKLYAAAGALDHTEDNLGVVLMVNPFNTRAMALLADVWLWKGHVDESRRILDRIRGYDPGDPNSIRCQQAIDRFERDVWEGNPPVSPPIPTADWLDYAVKRERSPRIRREIIELGERSGANDPVIQLEAMLALMDENRYAEAVKKANGVYRVLNNDANVCAAVCELLARTNNADSAVEIGIRAVQLDKNNKLAWRNLGIAYAQKKEYNESDRFFLEQIEGNASFSSMFYLNLGLQERKKGNYKKTVDYLEKALKSNPKNKNVYLLLAESLTIDKQPERAVEILKQALALDRDDPVLYASLGISLNELQRWDEGSEAFKTAIKLNPDNHYYHYNYAMGLMNRNKIEEALVEYQRAVDLKPDFLQGILQLGYCLSRADRLDEAAAQYRIILQSDPNYPYAHYNLGTIFRMQNKYDRAALEYEEEISRNSNLADPYDALAQMYCQSGEFERAKSVLERANARQIQLNETTVRQIEAGIGR